MALYSISAYNIRVKKKYSSESCNLGDFGEGYDLYDTMHTFFSRLQTNLSHDQNSRRLIQVGEVRRDENARIIEGIVKTGEYGYEAELVDWQTAQLSYRRKIREAEVLPFYFLMHLPRENDLGILLLQRFRQFGIRAILTDYISKFFHDNHEKYSLQFPPILTREVLQTLREEGIVEAIHIISHSLPQDKADALRIPREEASSDYVVRTKAHNKRILSGLKEKMLSGGNFRIAELESLQPGYDTVKIEVELGGQKRTVDLAKPKLRTVFDLSDRIRPEANGHPSFNSMSTEARSILVNLRRQLEG